MNETSRFSAHDLLLAIETSCDDTCAAVLRGSGEVLSSVVSSQGIHAEFVGVVPEIASREHLNLILPVIREALGKAGIELSDIRGIAVTQGPGLIGCLLVGLATAKGLSMSLGVPFVGVNHIAGHLSAIRAEREFDPPYVALVASGGHTELMYAEAWGEYQLLGATRDDAAGEAFDKVAKLLGLGFPGGPVVDKLAQNGDPTAVDFPRAWLGLGKGGRAPGPGDYDFSFSGLKTAVKYHVEATGIPAKEPSKTQYLEDVCASFQEAVAEVLLGKVEAACRALDVKRILLAGGVACNSRLRTGVDDLARSLGGEAAYARPALCGDNAVMIGMAGLPRLLRGGCDPIELPAIASLDDFAIATPFHAQD